MVRTAEYLADDFDPSRLTKPQLRSILASHGVVDLPPATARKEVLLDLFEEHVHSQAQSIKKAARVRASDKGIAFLDDKSQPSPKRSPPRAKSRRARSTATTKSRGHTTARDVSKSPTRRSPTRGKDKRGRSPAAQKSPVRKQSPAKEPSPVKKRMSTRSPTPTRSSKPARSPPPTESPRSATPTRRPRSPTRASSPLSILQRSLPKYSDSPQSATAKLHDRLEFIATANRLTGAKKVIEPTRRTRSKSPIRALILKTNPSQYLLQPVLRRISPILRFLFIGLVAVLVGAYVRFKLFYPLPYCQSGVALTRYLPRSTRDVMRMWQELCVPCPVHGSCRNGALVCEEGFVERPNWIALGSACLPDYRKMSMIDDMVSKTRTLLADRAGKALCGELEERMRVVTDVELAQLLPIAHPHAEWNSLQFDSLYRLALLDLGKNSANYGIDLAHNPIDGQIMLQSRTPRITLKCRLQLFFQNIYAQFFFQIWIGGAITVLVLLAVLVGYNNSKTSRRVDELVQAVLQILAEQDALNRRDPTVSSTISVHQIRDALFLKNNTRLRNRLWPKVCRAISLNTNVRESVMSIKGEQHRVWEWIGSDVLSPLRHHVLFLSY